MPRRVLEGDVVSDVNDKTITVLVERRFMHPLYKKYVKKNTKFAAHDPANSCKVGDRVRIIECAPISKNKRWIVEGAEAAAPKPEKKAAKKPAAQKEDVKKETAKKAAPKKEEAKKAAPKKETAKKTEAKKPAAKKATTKKDSKKKDS